VPDLLADTGVSHIMERRLFPDGGYYMVPNQLA